MDGGDFRALREEAGRREGVRLVFLHPQRQRLDAPQQQPGLERREHRAGGVLQEAETRQPFRVAVHQDAAHAVAVAVQVLRRRVHHDVRAVFQRPLEAGRGEGVVHDHRRAHAVRRLRERGEVGDPQHRVGGGFDEEERRAPVEFAQGRGGVARVHPDEVQPPAAQHPFAEPVGAPVTVAGGHHPLPAVHDLERHRRRRHPRGAGDRPGAAFEVRQVLFGGVPRGVPGAGVLVLAGAAGGGLDEGGGVHQRRHDGAGGRVRVLPHMDRPGGEPPPRRRGLRFGGRFGHRESGVRGRPERPILPTVPVRGTPSRGAGGGAGGKGGAGGEAAFSGRGRR